MKIILDNGHGEETLGKCSPVWPDGIRLYEYEFNRDIVRRIFGRLYSRGILADIIVPERNDVPLYVRANRANDICNVAGKDNCLLVSVHANAGGGTGWEAHTYLGDSMSDRYSAIFYEKAEVAFGKEWKIRRGNVDVADPDWDSNFAILRDTKCPAVLTENFFMDTEQDCRFLLSDEGRERIAAFHVEAIMACIEYHKEITGR